MTQRNTTPTQGNVMTAKALDAITLTEIQTLPNGVKVLMTDCPGPDALKTLPRVVQFDGQTFGRTGWNSDRCIAYYRSDAKVAMSL